jgi:hypothetical protein
MVPTMREKPPAKRALDAAAEPPPAAPVAPKRISAKVRAAIGFMVNGDCKKICEAAEKAGLARAVAGLVGIRVGVVSGVINLESSGVEASDWRLRHDQAYHEA